MPTTSMAPMYTKLPISFLICCINLTLLSFGTCQHSLRSLGVRKHIITVIKTPSIYEPWCSLTWCADMYLALIWHHRRYSPEGMQGAVTSLVLVVSVKNLALSWVLSCPLSSSLRGVLVVSCAVSGCSCVSQFCALFWDLFSHQIWSITSGCPGAWASQKCSRSGKILGTGCGSWATTQPFVGCELCKEIWSLLRQIGTSKFLCWSASAITIKLMSHAPNRWLQPSRWWFVAVDGWQRTARIPCKVPFSWLSLGAEVCLALVVCLVCLAPPSDTH